MAHLTDTPYISNSNVMPLLGAFVKSMISRHGNSIQGMSILIVGGAALALKHGERMTVDIDADIHFGGNISNSIYDVATMYNIPIDWLNYDFVKSYSYSRRLWDNAIHFVKLYDLVDIYIVNDIDHLCMKIVSGRSKDMDDIDRLCNALISKGITLRDVTDEYKFLYGDVIRMKEKAFKRVKGWFKRAKQL